jgi:hypothetical protein
VAVVVVDGSRWIAEWELANRVHRDHDAHRCRKLRHYLLELHDERFECVAAGFGRT